MRSRPTIKAITLDLDDTLWSIWPTIRGAEKTLYNWMLEHTPTTAAAISIADLTAERQEVQKLFPQHQHDLSFYRREAIRRLLQKHGDDEALAEEGFNIFFQARQNVKPFADVAPALARLSAHYPLVAITNGNSNLSTIGLSQFFKDCISAQSFGVCKPDQKIFLEAARILKIDAPVHILHIGDDFQLDVLAAKQVGFQTAWLKRPELNIPHVSESELSAADFLAKDLTDLCQQLNL